MTNYSADGSNVVDRWYKDGYLYCAFVDGTIMEYGRNKIPERYIEVMRNELAQTVYDLQGGKYDFDDFEPNLTNELADYSTDLTDNVKSIKER